MQLFKNVQSFKYRFITIFIVLAFSGSVEIIKAQSVNPTTKKKGEFISQEDKELEKVRKLKVKTRTKYSEYYDLNGQLPAKKTIVAKETFNRKGLLINMVEFNGVGKIVSTYKFSYDAKGNPIKAESKEINGRSSTQLSKYDSHGKEIERTLIEKRKNNYITKTLFKYDKDDNLIEIQEYSNNKLISKQNIFYKDGKKINTIVKDAKDNIALTVTSEYNASKKLIKEQRKEGNVTLSATYKYDSKGNLIEMIDNEVKRNYTLDENGNVTEHKMYLLDGRRQLRLMFKYGSNGLQTEVIRFDNNEKPVLYTNFVYEYYK